MEQIPDSSILESKVRKETYLLRTRKRFQNIKRFLVLRKYREEEGALREKLLSLLKKYGIKIPAEGNK
ncbi:MAG: hypothetical protein Sv326_0042 [Candidatus Fermentimicrarchaeum limneticum]|uniref:Uncharacterized protein n=1 Tax=Fermentimicrarchaeum limneticum TaxID=2795018 RepID=A0A7D6B9G8_FERL1|nr:MAG: hypothetical protein Sv326_0042 [Candidatus Fermentimicrarchaeum limneticum]